MSAEEWRGLPRISWREAEKHLGHRVDNRRWTYFRAPDGAIMTYGPPGNDQGHLTIVPAMERARLYHEWFAAHIQVRVSL